MKRAADNKQALCSRQGLEAGAAAAAGDGDFAPAPGDPELLAAAGAFEVDVLRPYEELSYRGSIGRRLRLPFSISQGGTFMIRNAIQRFMYGRYGNDPLNLFLMALYLLLYLAFVFTRFEPLYWAGFLLLTLTFFRLLSLRMFLWGSMEHDETGKKIFPVPAHIPQRQVERSRTVSAMSR